MSRITSKNSYEQLISAYFGRESDTVLPSEKKQFPLIGNMFEKCSLYYNKDSEGLILADNDRIFKCCLDNCSSSIDFCHKNCQQKHGDQSKNPNNKLYKRCRDQCNVITEDCELLCSQARKLKGDNDHFINEARRIGCWENDSNQPIHYCMKNCFPTANLNCEEHCDTSYNLAVDPTKVSKLFKNTISRTTVNDIQHDSQSKKSLLYILLGVCGGILLAIICFIIFIFKLK